MTFDSCSLPTFIELDATTPHCRLLPPGLSSQSSPRLWTACATTKKPLPNGLMAKPHSVPVTPYDLMFFIIPILITTWSWTATTYISMTAHTHPLRRVRFKTKSSHLPKKSRHPFALLCGRGLPGTHSLHYKRPILMNFGTAPFNPTTTPSTITSHTKT